MELVAASGTGEPEKIAERMGIRVESSSWFPVTHGEYDAAAGLIVVNTRSRRGRQRIIGHELGHVVQGRLGIHEHSEEFCEDFARELCAAEKLK